ncbi:MAG TPA: DMT family transporter, partial [Pyrinomonadaceae bacterium]|nr:DMT family transporter [Pyrinomonadaceae bacterium]
DRVSARVLGFTPPMKQPAAGAARVPDEHDARAYLFMLSSSLAFAVMGALGHLAGERIDWRLVACARTLLAFVFSAAFALSTGVRLVLFRPAVLWVRSIAGSLSLLCYFYAVTHLPVSTAITLSNTVPVWVTLLAWPVLGQRPALADWLAVSVGVVGVALVQHPQLGGDATAAALALASALGTAVAMLGLNRLGGVDARAVVTHYSGVSTAFAFGFLLLTRGTAARHGALAEAGTLALLLGVGVVGTLGQLAMTRAYALGSASRVSVVGLTQIVFALVLDTLLWRRQFDALTLAGILLVVAPSAWLTLRRPLRRGAQIHTTS